MTILIALALSACTPREQAFAPEAAKPRLEKNIFHAADEAMLPYRAWLPKGKPRAVIVALHGFNDYSNAFAEAGPYFAARGIAFYAYDQRGFGASPQAGVWPGEKNLAQDLAQFTALVHAKHPRARLYILGESMGGAVAVAALTQPSPPPLRGRARVGGEADTISPTEQESPPLQPPPSRGGGLSHVRGLILVAPALWGGEAMPALYEGTLWTLSHTLPFWTLTGSDLKIQATDNIPLLRKMSADPLIIKSTRIDAIYGLVGLMNHGYEATGNLGLPVLMLYGGRDQVIPRQAFDLAAARLAAGKARILYFPESYHMMLRDLGGKKPLEAIVQWVR